MTTVQFIVSSSDVLSRPRGPTGTANYPITDKGEPWTLSRPENMCLASVRSVSNPPCKTPGPESHSRKVIGGHGDRRSTDERTSQRTHLVNNPRRTTILRGLPFTGLMSKSKVQTNRGRKCRQRKKDRSKERGKRRGGYIRLPDSLF